MKYYVIPFLCLMTGLLYSPSNYAQNTLQLKEFYFGTGYNIGWGKFSTFNDILDRFNTENAGVQEGQFKDIHVPNGFCFALGTHLSVFNLELSFTGREQKRTTKYVENDVLKRMDARLKFNTLSGGAGVFFATSDVFGFGFTAFFDQHRLKMSYRRGDNGSFRNISFISPVRKKVYGMTGEMTLAFGRSWETGTKFMIKPFYSFIFKDVDAAPLDAIINGDSGGESLLADYSHWGLKFILSFSVVAK